MLNDFVGMGRLTRDPELRHTQSNIPVTSFTIAVDRDYAKEKEKDTDFLDCVAWRHTAEFVSRYFSKGQMAVVRGRIQNRYWNDRDGNKRKTTEILAENAYFGESKKNSDNRSDSYDKGDYGASDINTDFTELDDDDDELPF